MRKEDIIRAWKSEDFEANLSEDLRSQLPANPAGLPSVDDDALRTVSGGSHNCGSIGSFCADIYTRCP